MSFFGTYTALSKNGYQSGQPEGAGVWKYITDISTPNNFQTLDEVVFNYDGSLMFIGNFRNNVGNTTASGTVDVYSRTGSSWSLLTNITETIPANSYNFGRSIACDDTGNNIAISSLAAAGSGGTLYLYTRSGNTWSEQANVVPFSNIANIVISSVAMSNNASYIVAGGVGNLLANVNGLARIYTYASNTFTFQQELNPGVVNFTISDNHPRIIINGAGDKLITGERPVAWYTTNTATNSNLYYYTRSNTTWSLHTTFTGNIANSGFAQSYGLSDNGNYIVIGAPFNFAGGGNIVQVYSNVSNTYTLNQTITGNTVGGGVVGTAIQYAKNESWLIPGTQVDTIFDQDIDFLQKDSNGNYIFTQGLYNPGYQLPMAISGTGNYLAVWDAIGYPPNLGNYVVTIYSNE